MYGEDGVWVMNSKISNIPIASVEANKNNNPNNKKKATSAYTEDWINVRGINNGMIILNFSGLSIYFVR